MSALPLWLNNHSYELISPENGCEICRIRDVNNGSKKILKLVEVSDLDSKVVSEVVSKMNMINEMNIDGLVKYKVMEVSLNSLYRISREYKIHLDIINPLKYFEEVGVFEVLNGILNVMKVLDANGLIHSDLKPSNVFLNEENEVIIGDYLNNLLYKGREESQGMRRKKDLCFVCIDELCGLELDILSDIWNFGLIFYYVLSGKYPFIGSNMLETIDNIRDVKYDQIEREYDSDRLNSFLSKILIKEKKDRMKLNEIENELKKLNEAELPVIPFEEEEIKIDEKLKTKINSKIKKCKDSNVNVLDLEKYNDLSSNGLNIFSKCLKFFPNLETLYLSNNPIGNGGLKVFLENLHFIPKLRYLSFYWCELADNDMKDLSSHFKDIHNLDCLSLSCDDGVRYLCENLNEIPKLKELYLNYNSISDIGGDILLNNLHKCKELKESSIYGNKISNYEDFKRKMKEKHPNKSLYIE